MVTILFGSQGEFQSLHINWFVETIMGAERYLELHCQRVTEGPRGVPGRSSAKLLAYYSIDTHSYVAYVVRLLQRQGAELVEYYLLCLDAVIPTERFELSCFDAPNVNEPTVHISILVRSKQKRVLAAVKHCNHVVDKWRIEG